MSFVELLARLGGMGRFQVTYVAALATPLLMLASHNLLQNFTAGTPEHHCQPRPAANATAADVPLVVSIPLDGHRRPQSCRRYVEPQWHLLDVNGSANGTATEAATEPCHDGWTYLDGIFTDTIITEWDLVCDSKKLKQVAQSIYMAGILLGSCLFGVLSDKCVLPRRWTGRNWEELGGAGTNWEVLGRERGGACSLLPWPPLFRCPQGGSVPAWVVPLCPHVTPSVPSTPQCSQCAHPSAHGPAPVTPVPLPSTAVPSPVSPESNVAPSQYLQFLTPPTPVLPVLPVLPVPCPRRFGRRALLTWCYLQLGATGVGTAAAPSLLVYCVCRFLTGLAMAGVSLNSASLCMEWIPTEARAVVGTINGYCYTLGQFVLAAVAFVLPRWRQLQLAVSLPFFVFFFYSWLYVESARWQVTSGRADLALRGLRKVARINGRKEEGDKLSEEALRALVHREPPLPGGAVAALARTPGMRTVSCGVSFVWFSTSFAYYGLAMDLQGFGFNVYLSQLVFGAVDIPAKLLSVLVISCLGRRPAQGGSLALAGLCILANIFVPSELPTLRMAFAVVGKGALAASFNCAYIFTGELFPTIIRQTGMGLGGTMARVGSMVAPLVRMMADVSPALPLVIYGAAPIVSAIATCFLPETRNAPLPETVKDVERRAGHLEDDDVAVPLSSTKSKDGA
uniref:Major facilitator superfamily (MFS) profile domain-containing protein n=1 Tax=Taeniopygia guttata TaxID=59729 RepID=A0A674G6W1_TAEGU